MKQQAKTFWLMIVYSLFCMVLGGCLYDWFSDVDWPRIFRIFWGNG